MLDGPGAGDDGEEARPEDVDRSTGSGRGYEVHGGYGGGAICLEGGVALHQGYEDAEDHEAASHLRCG